MKPNYRTSISHKDDIKDEICKITLHTDRQGDIASYATDIHHHVELLMTIESKSTATHEDLIRPIILQLCPCPSNDSKTMLLFYKNFTLMERKNSHLFKLLNAPARKSKCSSTNWEKAERKRAHYPSSCCQCIPSPAVQGYCGRGDWNRWWIHGHQLPINPTAHNGTNLKRLATFTLPVKKNN